MPDNDSQAVFNSLLASGFPFQTAIFELVNKQPNCALLAEEFPWRDEDGNDRFLDLVISCLDSVLVIECKKTKKEIFAFLRPTTRLQGAVSRARCAYLSQIQDSSQRLALFCADWLLHPQSQEASFCVVSTSDSGKDQRLLERDAQTLIRGADAFGRHQMKSLHVGSLGISDKIIVPVIVTNAKLYEAIYDPTTISLDTGQLPGDLGTKISPLQWVCFRKAFVSDRRDSGERTVFVVAAAWLQAFLRTLSFSSPEVHGRVLLDPNVG